MDLEDFAPKRFDPWPIFLPAPNAGNPQPIIWRTVLPISPPGSESSVSVGLGVTLLSDCIVVVVSTGIPGTVILGESENQAGVPDLPGEPDFSFRSLSGRDDDDFAYFLAHRLMPHCHATRRSLLLMCGVGLRSRSRASRQPGAAVDTEGGLVADDPALFATARTVLDALAAAVPEVGA